MTSGRVDQVTAPGVLRNHEARIRALEANPLAEPGTGLPPWFDASPAALFIDQSGGGGDLAPTPDTTFFWIMVQTGDGTTYPDGGNPVGHGTALWAIEVTLTDAGSIGGDETSDGVFGVVPTSDAGRYAPQNPTDGYVIGSGYIQQGSTNTFFPVTVLSDGRLRVNGLPDLFAPNSRAQNCCRIANPALDPPSLAWPWAFDDGDIINVSGTYPMQVD